MNRKNLGWLLTTILLATSSSVQGQQPAKAPRIGFYLDASASAVASRVEGFRQGIRELGYIEGKNIIIEWRSAEGKPERRSEIAAELVRLRLTSSSLRGRQEPVLSGKQLRRYPSSWRKTPTRWAAGLSPVLRDLAAISLDCRLSPPR